jgi:hypothetical protein
MMTKDIDRSGKINHNLLDELNNCNITTPLKSLGFEFVKKLYCLLLKLRNEPEDKLRTFTDAAMQIAFVCQKKRKSFITGGGTHNVSLLKSPKPSS